MKKWMKCPKKGGLVEDEEKEKAFELNISIHVWNSNVEFCTVIFQRNENTGIKIKC